MNIIDMNGRPCTMCNPSRMSAQFDPYKFALNGKAQVEAHAEADSQNPNKLYWAQRCFANPSGRGCKKRMADFCRGMPNHPFCLHEYTGLAQTEVDAQTEQSAAPVYEATNANEIIAARALPMPAYTPYYAAQVGYGAVGSDGNLGCVAFCMKYGHCAGRPC